MNYTKEQLEQLTPKDVDELAKFSVFLNLLHKIKESNLPMERKLRRAKALYRLVYGKNNA